MTVFILDSWTADCQSSCYLRGFTVSGPTALPLKYLFMSHSKQISYVILISLYLPEPELVCCMVNLFVWEITLKFYI